MLVYQRVSENGVPPKNGWITIFPTEMNSFERPIRHFQTLPSVRQLGITSPHTAGPLQQRKG